MMPVIDQGQNDHNGLSVGKENMCHCDLSCYSENVFPWNFCNSHALQVKGISKYEWLNGKFRQNLHRAADLKSYCYLDFLNGTEGQSYFGNVPRSYSSLV